MGFFFFLCWEPKELSSTILILYHPDITDTKDSPMMQEWPSVSSTGAPLALPALKLQTAEGEIHMETSNVQAKISLIGWDWGQSILQARLNEKQSQHTCRCWWATPRCAGEGAGLRGGRLQGFSRLMWKRDFRNGLGSHSTTSRLPGLCCSLSLLACSSQQPTPRGQSVLLTCSWTCTGGAGNRFFSWKNSKNEASREENPSSVTVWTSKEGKEIGDRSL